MPWDLVGLAAGWVVLILVAEHARARLERRPLTHRVDTCRGLWLVDLTRNRVECTGCTAWAPLTDARHEEAYRANEVTLALAKLEEVDHGG